MRSKDLDDFVALLARDAGLCSKIGLDEAVSNPNFENSIAFAAAAVEAGNGFGLQLTLEECRDWLDEQAGRLSSAELSDMQLDAVTGGQVAPTDSRRRAATPGPSTPGPGPGPGPSPSPLPTPTQKKT